MKQTTFKDKYPVWTLELEKTEVTQKNVPEILAYFKSKIEAHPIAVYIATFDHYSHTKNQGGAINPDIKDMQNIIFCFGPEIPNTKVGAVRPRSIAVCELNDKFVIEFMEAPSEKAQDTMEVWAKALKQD
ncbi:MAG: hypothetical protein DSZ05_08850 [Sulfurospirillum sp.]|nr:MAG: hypothetical protein DSZ05_08850 [Sulfurospirillum sp.]